MPLYCFDTSGFSRPLQEIPPDIHVGVWNFVNEMIASGSIIVTLEIFEQMAIIDNGFGDFILEQKDLMVKEVGDQSWDWEAYIDRNNQIIKSHSEFISELGGGGKKDTVDLKDISIISLASCFSLPVVSGETRKDKPGSKKRGIPDICDAEDVSHLDFNQFLREVGYSK